MNTKVFALSYIQSIFVMLTQSKEPNESRLKVRLKISGKKIFYGKFLTKRIYTLLIKRKYVYQKTSFKTYKLYYH